MRKTSAREIEKLYEFTRKHYVEYYDLQTELVDHLANGMEERWTAAPDMPFEENLQHEFNKFGVFGFSDVVEKQQKAMDKKYWKLIWKEIQLELNHPTTLFLFVAMIGVSTFLLQLKSGYLIMSYLTAIVGVIGVIYFGLNHFFRKKKEKQSNKKYLLEVMIENMGRSFPIVLLPYYLFNTLHAVDLASNSILFSFALGLLISTIVLIVYIVLVVLPKKKNEILRKVHPEIELIP